MTAFTKIAYYQITCGTCGRAIYFQARESELKAGWEFRMEKSDVRTDRHGERFWLKEVAYCPHCRLLVKT